MSRSSEELSLRREFVDRGIVICSAILSCKTQWGEALCELRSVCAALSAGILVGCAVIPDIPPDFALPVRAILAQTACELRDAFIALDSRPAFKRFKAKQWLVTVSLLPRADTDLTASGGLTRKTLNNPTRFTTWSLSGPGAQIDDKGVRSSGINFNFNSGALMSDRTLQCPPDYPSIHTLAQHLGVGEWLFRSAEAMTVSSAISVDKPVYNSEITIRLSANGSYTFTFPPGTNVAAFSGSYSLDEQLNISMAPVADKQELVVTSLPSSQQYTRAVTSRVELSEPQVRLDLQGIETAIRKLQTQ